MAVVTVTKQVVITIVVEIDTATNTREGLTEIVTIIVVVAFDPTIVHLVIEMVVVVVDLACGEILAAEVVDNGRGIIFVTASETLGVAVLETLVALNTHKPNSNGKFGI